MKNFRKIVAALAITVMIGSITGCGIVKIIPKGTEAEYTGATVFDASAEAAGDWANIQAEVVENAAALADVQADVNTDTPVCVSFTATVDEYVEKANGQKCSYNVTVDGVSTPVTIQMGTNYSGTAVRDAQTFKVYGDFTNQTEWSEYATTINAEVQTNVVEPLGDLSALQGKSIDVVGCAVLSSGEIVVTPVSITAQ